MIWMHSSVHIDSVSKVGSNILGVAFKRAQNIAYQTIGIIWDPPQFIGSLANSAFIIFSLTFFTGSWHKGPSHVAHLNPYVINSLTV